MEVCLFKYMYGMHLIKYAPYIYAKSSYLRLTTLYYQGDRIQDVNITEWTFGYPQHHITLGYTYFYFHLQKPSTHIVVPHESTYTSSVTHTVPTKPLSLYFHFSQSPNNFHFPHSLSPQITYPFSQNSHTHFRSLAANAYCSIHFHI